MLYYFLTTGKKRFALILYARALSFLLCLSLFSFPYDASAFTRVFLTTSSASPWTLPSDWSGENTIEAIGGGGAGANGSNGFGPGGAGGGAYVAVFNVSLTSASNLEFMIGSTTAPSAAGATSTATFFSRSDKSIDSCSSAVVCAAGGGGAENVTGGVGARGGSAATSTGTVKFSGGNGGTGNGSDGSGGSGGAAGPYGNGGNGGNAGTTAGGGGGGGGGGTNGQAGVTTVAGIGGANFLKIGEGAASGGAATSSGAGGGGGAASGNGGNAADGALEWTVTFFGVNAGAGGGGGGAGNSGNGGNAGIYGGGGGTGENVGRAGGAGVIVITYIPDVATSPRQVRLLGNVRFLGGVKLLYEDSILNKTIDVVWNFIKIKKAYGKSR